MNFLIGPVPGWRCYRINRNKLIRIDIKKEIVNFNYESGNFDQLIDMLPNGWKPDIIFLERPEYASILKNIENSPFPVVAMVGDWNQGFTVLKDNLSKVDWIVVDKKGVSFFKKQGFKNIDYWGVYGFRPEYHYLREGFKRTYDLLMIGNFNFEIQKEREAWIKRIALLNSKYNIQLLSNIFGEEYPILYNQAKIIFNRSIRGEMNQRSFEATANGALLFFEEENLEIRDFLIPGKECILYNENNLDWLIDYYLINDEERENIAQAGHKKIQNYTYEKQLKNLVLYLKQKGILTCKYENRQFFTRSFSEQYYQNAKIAMQEISLSRLEYAKEMLEKSVQFDKDNYEARNLLSMVTIIQMEKSKDEEERTFLFDKSVNNYIDIIEELPNAGLVHYNLAYICQSVYRYELAEAELLKALETANNHEPLGIYEYFFPRDYITFRMEWENIAASLKGEPERQEETYKTLLRFQCSFNLGNLKIITRQFEEALKWYKKAVLIRPDLAGICYFKIGELERLFGRNDIALEAFNKCLELKPFTVDAWKCKIETLRKMGLISELLNFSEEILLIIKRCPAYQNNLSWIMPIYKEAQE